MKPRSSKISTTFSTLSEAMIVQRNLRNDPTYKELKKFFFRDIDLLREYLVTVDEKVKIQVCKISKKIEYFKIIQFECFIF